MVIKSEQILPSRSDTLPLIFIFKNRFIIYSTKHKKY
jgi:hypothetical protein